MSSAIGMVTNSGLPSNIVEQLMQAEHAPVQRIEAKKQNVLIQRNLLSELQNLMQDLRTFTQKNLDPISFKEYKIDYNTEFLDITFDKTLSSSGTYQIEIARLAQSATYASNTFSSKEEAIGAGHIEYKSLDGEEKKIFISTQNSTLENIARTLNSTRDLPYSASVIHDHKARAFRLILSPKEGATDSTLPKLSFFDSNYINLSREGNQENAKVLFAGFEVQSETNTIKDLIPGTTITLKKAAPNVPIAINITEDLTETTNKVSEFIEKINRVFSFISRQNQLNETVDSSRTLGGDITLNTLESRLREAVMRPVETSLGTRRASDLGIHFTREGGLSLSQEKLDSLTKNDLNLVLDVLIGKGGDAPSGIFGNVLAITEQTLQGDHALLQSKRRALQTQIDQMDSQIAQRLRHLEARERGLREKFTRLEDAVSKIRANAPPANI